MEQFIIKLKKIIKRRNAKKFNKYVKMYYYQNKGSNIQYLKNIWNKNFYWDFYFQSFPHSVKSRNYVPYDYYNYKVLPNFNDLTTKIYVKDKNMFDKIFGESAVKLPKTIFRCMNNIFMDDDYSTIKNISEFINNIDYDIIVKKALWTSGGGGVQKYLYREGKLVNYSDNKSFDLNEISKSLGTNFIVQEVLEQHSELAKYHPHSLNTIKVLTYRSIKTNEVSILLSYFRIGVDKSFLDSASNGGLAVGIDIDNDYKAMLMENGVHKYGNDYTSIHPNTNLKFLGNEIPNFHLIFKKIKKLSNMVPYQRIIGWDFSVDKNGEPVLIESNYGSNIGGLQAANGKPLFGEFTDEVKDYLKNIK